jgi:hypothetical protein
MNKMIQTERPNVRPDCEEILENTNEWTLNEKEFGVKDELEKDFEINSKQRTISLFNYMFFK